MKLPIFWIGLINLVYIIENGRCTPIDLIRISDMIEKYTNQKIQQNVSVLSAQLRATTVELENCREHRRSLVQYYQQPSGNVHKKRVTFKK